MIDVGILPDACDDNTNIHHLFYIGFPVSSATKDGYLSFRSKTRTNISAESLDLRYPNFRIGTKDIASWTITRSEKSEILRGIDDFHKDLPLAYIVNIELLNELINKRWDGRTVIG